MFFQKLQIDVLDGLNHSMAICIFICWLEEGSEWLRLDFYLIRCTIKTRGDVF